MTELLTAARMQALERAAIESGQVSGLELMERAGRGVVEAIFARWPDMAQGDHRALVLCGPGNNGGDGFVIARLLRQWGWQVALYLWGDPARLPPDARANLERWRALGVVHAWDAVAIGEAGADIYVDALFGAGLRRAPPAEISEPFARLAATGRSAGRVVAVDAPTGLCMDSGRVLAGEEGAAGAVRAALTVTFHRPRPGHYLAEGPEHCGALAVVDIGLAGGGDGGLRLACPAVAELARRGGHKYDHGHVLVLAGGPGRGGAARLAARGALRIGAGLVTLGVEHAALAENAARLDAVMLAEVDTGDALARLLEDRRINALCLGPGLGHGRARDLVPVALAAGRPAVLDADALSAFAEDPAALFSRLHDRVVLTPHGGEFARLFPDLARRLSAPATRGPAFSRVDAARQAAARAGCVVLLKGADTVIAAPEGAAVIHAAAYERAAPWLATAGAGDVLAGLIAGLLARGFAPLAAAESAAWLHVEVARRFGPGLIAEDLAPGLPAVLADLLAG